MAASLQDLEKLIDTRMTRGGGADLAMGFDVHGKPFDMDS